jgi:hypothetical protein
MAFQGSLKVDPSSQWEWHEAHRDMAKNQYRTTYTDMVHAKETCMKSDYPSGYGGHVPNVRFDVLFRNTSFDRNLVLRRNDPSRDSHPSFKDHIAGIPTVCSKPQGAKKNPTYGVVPHDGTTSTPIAPWAVLNPVKAVPCHRVVPQTLKRARSYANTMQGMQRSNGMQGMQRSNGMAQSNPALLRSGAEVVAMPASPAASPTPHDRVGFAVSMANQDAKKGRIPTEQEMLMEEMGMRDED